MADTNEKTIEDIYTGAGNFLKTADIKLGDLLECEITAVAPRDFGDKKKLVTYLKNGKSFVVNATNAKALAIRFNTPNYEKWVGQKFRIVRTTTQFQGSVVECLRVV